METSRTQRSTPPRRILIVDDNVDSATTLALLLKIQQHEVYMAHDGPTAISIARESTPEIVLLDIGMPGMDGYEAAGHLRRLPGGNRILLVALTGWGQEQYRRRTQEAGFDHHFVKPVQLAQLEGLLHDFEKRPPPQS